MYTIKKILAAIAVADPREAGIIREVVNAYSPMDDVEIASLRDDARRLADILATTLRGIQRTSEAQRLFIGPIKTRNEVLTLLETIEEIEDARYLTGSSAIIVCAKLLGALSYKDDADFRVEQETKRALEEAQRATETPLTGAS